MSSKRKPIKIVTRRRKRPKTGQKLSDGVSARSSESSRGGGIPSILSKTPTGLKLPSSSSHDDMISGNADVSADADADADVNADADILMDMDMNLPSDIILALESLKQRYACCTCDFVHGSAHPMVFATRPVLNAALRISVSSSYNNKNKNSSVGEIEKQKQTDQIASSIASTGFDMDIKKSCANGEIKIIQLQGLNGEEDLAVFQMEEYMRGLQDVRTNNSSLSLAVQRHRVMVVDLFISCVKDFTSTFVLGQELQCAMQRKNRKNKDDKYVLHEDKWIDELIAAQLLLPRRHPSASVSTSGSNKHAQASYWFTLPKLGQSASLIAEGRRRMVLKLKRAPNRELKRNSLEMNARGGMAGPFHVRDLLARGVAKVFHTPNGQFIRLVTDEDT